MRTLSIARGLVALASAALALLELAYGEFSPLGQALPAALHGRDLWLQASAWLLLVASPLCFLPTAMPAVALIGTYEIAWAIASTPPILTSPFTVGAWYGLCEATSSLAAPALLYIAYRCEAAPRWRDNALTVVRILFGLTCVFYGYSHFLYAEYTASMVPAWLPARLPLAYLTGLAHIAAGLALVGGIVPALAAALEALMMSLFGLLVWVPSFFMQPRPKWATPPGNQWSELVVTLVLALSAWLLAAMHSKRKTC